MSKTPNAQEQNPNSIVLLDGITETTVSEVASVGGFRHKEITIATDSLSSGKEVQFEVMGSNQHDVDFESSASESNRWTLVQLKDLTTQTSYNGSITISDSDDIKTLAINTDGFRWLAVKATFTGTGQTATAQLDLFGKFNEDN